MTKTDFDFYCAIEKRYMNLFRQDAPEQALKSEIIQRSWNQQVNAAVAELKARIEEGCNIILSVETVEQKLIQGKFFSIHF
jgi:hypothetical protein